MTTVKLNGKNYILWSKSVEMFLKGKGLHRTHLVDSMPESTSSTFAQWEQEDAQICSLMLTKLKIYQPITSDVSIMLKQREKFNVVRFLVGLKPEYESVCSQILASPQLPSFLDVFSRLQRATLSGPGSQLSSDQNNERSALVASYVAPSGHGGRGDRGCTNYSVDYCWDLHGRPSRSANQNLKTGKKIGTGHETGGLYYLDVEQSPT
ncbi:hypothetical protein I3760_09G156600 [Carya illinoinensis]|nr:hypothetical protein I3760_09G156600 [Carya illinoinensis]